MSQRESLSFCWYDSMVPLAQRPSIAELSSSSICCLCSCVSDVWHAEAGDYSGACCGSGCISQDRLCVICVLRFDSP